MLKLLPGEHATCTKLIRVDLRHWQPCGQPAIGRSDAGAARCSRHLDPLTNDDE